MSFDPLITSGDGSVVQNEPQVSLLWLFFVLIFRSWDFHVNYFVWDAFCHIFSHIYTSLWNGEALD